MGDTVGTSSVPGKISRGRQELVPVIRLELGTKWLYLKFSSITFSGNSAVKINYLTSSNERKAGRGCDTAEADSLWTAADRAVSV